MTENNGGELGTGRELSQQDKSFSESSKSEQELEENAKAAEARTGEKFLACGLLAGCEKKVWKFNQRSGKSFHFWQ